MQAGKRFVARSSPYSRLAYPGFRPVPLNPGESGLIASPGGFGEMGEAGSAAAVIGIGIGALVLTVGTYVLLAYGIAWGAGRGWKKAKGK